MSDLPGLERRRTLWSFAQWDEFLSPELVVQSENTIRQLIERLIVLGAQPTRQQVQAEIDGCLKQFNDLDSSVQHSWIFRAGGPNSRRVRCADHKPLYFLWFSGPHSGPYQFCPVALTIEREDIGEVLFEIIDFCGFDGSEEWLNARDW